MPERFRGLDLDTLRPVADRHPKQVEIIPALQARPEQSYFFGGLTGTGKTTFLWTLYKHAVLRMAPHVVVCTLTELLSEFRAYIQVSIAGGEGRRPRLDAVRLRQNNTRYSIFLDDVDKARPTEYAAEQLFEIVNAIYEYGHQIVVTTNLSAEDLVAHFDRVDERFGSAIVRRLLDEATVFEMF